MALLVTNIPWTNSEHESVNSIAKRLGISDAQIRDVKLLKKSVDGRRRPPVWLANYRVEIESDELAVLASKPHGVRLFTERDENRFRTDWSLSPLTEGWPQGIRPIVVGAGPAGLFAALRLAEAGAPALLLERGADVDGRHRAVRAFWRRGELDTETNVVFGEGGAGTFSDGKIYTRRRDGALGWIFSKFVEFGADPSILEEGWTHLGTDRLREILPRMRKSLMARGIDVRFGARVAELLVDGGKVRGVRLDDGTALLGGPVVMATGHSARDSWDMMLAAGAKAEARSIHVGARIEHPQKLIDQARYGGPRGDFPPSSYRLTSNPKSKKGGRTIRPAHTFCMCPGGTVVAATNHPGRVVVNGMSYSGRKAWWANSAIVVSIPPEDFPGTGPLAGVRFQDAIEQAAYHAGGGDYRAPAQRVTDLIRGQLSGDLPRVSYTMGVQSADLRDVLPPQIIDGMLEAIHHFDKQVPGFAGPEGVLIAPETRTTSPIKFLRDERLESVSLPGLMPVGEGAGHAGGIASAALDGFRAANSIIESVGAQKQNADK